MKFREQRPSEFSLQNKAVNSPDTEESIDEENPPQGCHIEDAKTKFGTLFFGILLLAAGTALLYFGFRPNPEAPKGNPELPKISETPKSNKTSSDNKIFLTCGFVSILLGLFCFVVSILMFKDVPCLYNDNLYQIEEDINT